MDVFRAAELSEHRQELAEAVCLLVAPGDSELLALAAERLGLSPATRAALADPARSARADLAPESVVLTLWTIDVQGEPSVAVAASTGRGLLVVVDEPVAGAVSTAVSRADGPGRALAAAALTIADQTEQRVAALAESAEDVDVAGNGFFTGEQRRTLVAFRARLLRLQHQCAAQQRVLTRDADLSEAVPGLVSAAERYAAAADSAAAAYAALGDALDDLRTTVSERLTIVSTVFLPLTLAGGFFGMNFGWMADHLDGAAVFVVLGIVLPVLMTVATMRVVRRLSD
jgi:Mg2+ and Co2+ transporter CorA